MQCNITGTVDKCCFLPYPNLAHFVVAAYSCSLHQTAIMSPVTAPVDPAMKHWMCVDFHHQLSPLVVNGQLPMFCHLKEEILVFHSGVGV